MPLTTDHYDLEIPENTSPDTLNALADALHEVGTPDTRERIQMARNQRPDHIMKVLRHAIRGIFNTWVKEADWNKAHGHAVAAF